ncbi:MAG: hypothetical protein V4671_04785 [Armatimonadota bacterium]
MSINHGFLEKPEGWPEEYQFIELTEEQKAEERRNLPPAVDWGLLSKNNAESLDINAQSIERWEVRQAQRDVEAGVMVAELTQDKENAEAIVADLLAVRRELKRERDRRANVTPDELQALCDRLAEVFTEKEKAERERDEARGLLVRLVSAVGVNWDCPEKHCCYQVYQDEAGDIVEQVSVFIGREESGGTD